MKFLYSIIISIFLVPNFAFASFSITEIMYDPKDTDASAGGEWIEVHNDGSVPLDLTKWIFFEADTNHSITADGVSEIPPGEYAVISRDLTVFKNFFTGFSGSLFKASFSLNDGEKLSMKNGKEASPSDEVTYTAEWGAKNDGNSLQKNSNGTFVGAVPTPAFATVSSVPSQSDSPAVPQATSQNNTSNWPVEQQIFANAGSDRIVVVGADVVFEGKALGLEKKPLENARYLWNFGDGSTKEGSAVSHVYKYPGEYTVILDVSSGYFSGSDRAKIIAEESKIFISSIGDETYNYIELSNGSKYEIDLSSWILKSGTVVFYLPARTYIGGNKKLIIPAESSGIMETSPNNTELLYPNGVLATRYGLYLNNETNKVTTNAGAADTTSNKSSPAEVSNNEANGEQKDSIPNNTAAVLLSENKKNANGILPKNYNWLLGILGVIAVSFIGISVIPKKTPPNTTDKKLSAKDFKIIEEE